MFSQRTINHAAPLPGSFWQWSPDHDAVEWYDGSTLAQWPEASRWKRSTCIPVPPAASVRLPATLPDGSVVIAWQGGGVIYPPDNRVSECATLFLPADAGDPADICSMGIAGFAILTSSGKLVVFGG